MARIMVVDDSAFMRRMVKDMLVQGGHTIVGEADNGLKALQLYEICQPDVVTMDITMPIMSGLDAVKELTKRYPKSRVIMCSAMGQRVLVLEAIESGARDFLIKPFKAEDVLDRVANVLER